MDDMLSKFELLGERRIALAGASNFRDLGGLPAQGGRRVVRGQVYRSDALQRLTADDLAVLERELGIGHVIDLRSERELERDGRGRLARAAYEHAPLVDVALDPFDPAIDWQAIDLRARYLEMLRTGGDVIRRIFEHLAAAHCPPTVLHCSGGKDRTGVIAALLLRALGVADAWIVADYALSEECLRERIAAMRPHLIDAGVPPVAVDYLTRCDPMRMQYTLDELDRRWGSTEGYLAEIGVASGTVSALRARLLR